MQIIDGFQFRALACGGFGCIGEEIGKHLTQFRWEAVDHETLGKVRNDGDAEDGESAFHQQQDGAEHLAEVDFHWRAGFPVEREHGSADLGDAGDFKLGELEELLMLLRGGFAIHEEEQV